MSLKTYLLITSILCLFVLVNLNAQTPYISNGSFEENFILNPTDPTPNNYWVFCPGFAQYNNSCNNASGGGKDNIDDPIIQIGHEVGRCLGKWADINWLNSKIDPDINPSPTTAEEYYEDGYKKIPFPVEMPGWYSPTGGTADYFRRKESNCTYYTPIDYYRDPAGVPYNFYNQNHYIEIVRQKYYYEQHPYGVADPTGSQTNETEKSYCGLYFKRRVVNNAIDVNYKYNKNEYLQKKLETKLTAGLTYKVSFWVSRGHISTDELFFNKKALKAYFSEESLMIQCNNGYEERPFTVNEFNLELEHFAKINSSSGNTPLANITYFDADNIEYPYIFKWHKIEGKIKPKTDLYYLTIGNFNIDWINKNEITYNNQNYPSEINLYYYIDNVEITQVSEESCSCINPLEISSYIDEGITVSFTQKAKQPNSNTCCYDIWINPHDDLGTCKVSEATLFQYVNNELIPVCSLSAPSNPGYFEKGVPHDIGDFCFDGSNQGQYTEFRIEYKIYGTNQSCFSEAYLTPYCACGCDISPEDNIEIQIRETYKDNDKCCYEIVAKNKSNNCEVSLNDVVLSSFDPDFNNLYITSGYELQHLTNEKKITRTPDVSMKIYPNQELIIGTFCVNRGTSISNINISWSIFINNEIVNCNEQITENISCDCCDLINITNDPAQQPPSSGGYCCYNVTATLMGSTCQVNNVLVYDEAFPNNPIYNGPMPNNILSLTNICVLDLTPSPSSKKLIFIFKDAFNNIICDSKYIILNCGGEYNQGGSNSVLYEFLSHAEIEPNPANDIIKLKYILKKQTDINISLYNIEGQMVQIIPITNKAIGPSDTIISIKELPVGIYYIIISDRLNNTIKLAFIKNK